MAKPKLSPDTVQTQADALAAMREALNHPMPMADDDERRLWLPPSARTNAMRASFNDVQRQQLTELGVDAEQLKRLGNALRVIKLYTAAPAALNNVRKSLSKLATAVSNTFKLVECLMRAPAHEDALGEARNRLVSAWFHANTAFFHSDPTAAMAITPLAAERAQLGQLRDIAEHALHQIPRTQSRRVSPFYPIEYIDIALLIGFRTTHRDAKSKPRYPFKLSVSESSKFRQVAEVCYEAAGTPHSNPERAIKAYMAANPNSRERQQRILAAEAPIFAADL